MLKKTKERSEMIELNALVRMRMKWREEKIKIQIN